ncbi:MAG: response regulator [Pseudomonadota bacterium]
MNNGIDELLGRHTPTAARPLLGLTLLLVEDSRFASEAFRLMCLRSGARIRRADSLRSARRHLANYRPSVVIVDMGLPDGSGAELIRELANGRSVEVLLATSGDDDALETAIAAGADGCLSKPVLSLGSFQEEILSHLPPEARPRGPREISDEVLVPDEIALKDDLTHVAELMQDEDPAPRLAYVAQFVEALANGARDNGLAEAARALRQEDIEANAAACARLRALIEDRISRCKAM